LYGEAQNVPLTGASAISRFNSLESRKEEVLRDFDDAAAEVEKLGGNAYRANQIRQITAVPFTYKFVFGVHANKEIDIDLKPPYSKENKRLLIDLMTDIDVCRWHRSGCPLQAARNSSNKRPLPDSAVPSSPCASIKRAKISDSMHYEKALACEGSINESKIRSNTAKDKYVRLARGRWTYTVHHHLDRGDDNEEVYCSPIKYVEEGVWNDDDANDDDAIDLNIYEEESILLCIECGCACDSTSTICGASICENVMCEVCFRQKSKGSRSSFQYYCKICKPKVHRWKRSKLFQFITTMPY
jgi:hypothetical protein